MRLGRFNLRDLVFIVGAVLLILWWLPSALSSDRNSRSFFESLSSIPSGAIGRFIGSRSPTPSELVTTFYRAVEQGDRTAIRSAMTSRSILRNPDLFDPFTRYVVLEKEGIDSIEIMHDRLESPDRASVVVRLHYGDGSSQSLSSVLVRDDGEWKLDQ